MTLRIPILLLAFGLAAFWYCQPIPAPAVRPEVQAPASPLTPEEVVRDLERRYNLPGALDRAWAAECSRQLIGQPQCRNRRVGGASAKGLSVGERGSFQMTRSAAEHRRVRCEYKRLGVGDFAYEAECAAKYLHYWKTRCGDQAQGETAYRRGFCTSTPKSVAKR